ncbi:hypothetical protein FEK47_09715 [Escherichia sp. E3659]|nr:hypothetical protein FEK47_09715 [Escherichia sp. E3659]
MESSAALHTRALTTPLVSMGEFSGMVWNTAKYPITTPILMYLSKNSHVNLLINIKFFVPTRVFYVRDCKLLVQVN